jgi:hypothetical protein
MKAQILFKKKGTYVTFTKDFADMNHLNNYVRLMESRGFKEIGTYLI